MSTIYEHMCYNESYSVKGKIVNQISAIEVKSVLTKQSGKQRIPYDFTINPYRGCLFGCSYCYASKFVHDDDDKKAE